MYSLVSAPVLGFDLCRLDGGPAAAGILIRAMALTPDDLPALADQLPDDGTRAALWHDIELAVQDQPTVTGLAADRSPAALAKLERAPIGSLDSLLRLVRQEILDWTWDRSGRVAEQPETARRATSVISDAVAACYLSERLDPATIAALLTPWELAMAERPATAADLGPQQLALTSLYERLRTAEAGDATRLTTAAERGRAETIGWAQAVHSASWAVYTTDRIRQAAAAQLLLVDALHPVVTVTALAGGVWNLLSGTAQAMVVRDVLDEDNLHRLLTPCVTALGPLSLVG